MSGKQVNPFSEERTFLAAGPFGGVDTTTEPYYVQGSNFVDIQNIMPNAAYGGFVTALGREVFAALPGRIRGITRFARPGILEGYIYAVDVGSNGQLYYVTPGNAPVLLALPVGYSLTPATQYTFACADQWCFLVNGVDTPLKIDENLVVTYWGIVAPATAPTLIINATPSLMVGTYTYNITFASTTTESSEGAISSSLTVVNQSISLAGIPISTDPQVTQRNIYRIGGSSGIWQLVATIHDNVTTTYTDSAADPTLTITQVARRDPPGNFVYIAAHQERIFGFLSPAQVYFSNYQEPWSFDNDTGYLPVGTNALDDYAVGMASTGSVLALMKSESLYAVFGDSDNSFIVQHIADIGCTSQRSIWQGYGICGWMSRIGSHTWDGNSVPSNISEGGFQQSNVKKSIDNFTESQFGEITSFFFDKMIFHSVPSANITYLFDLRTKNWFILSWALDQVYYRPESFSRQVLGANLQTLGQSDNWFQTPNDLGEPITAYILTGITDTQEPQAVKAYKHALICGPNQPAFATVYVTVNPGSNQRVCVRGIDLSKGGPQHQVGLAQGTNGAQVQCKVIVRTTDYQVHIQSFLITGQVQREFIVNDSQQGTQ